MEVEEKTNVKKRNSQGKTMCAITGNNVRHIIEAANDKNIQNADIVSLVREGGQFVLIYYK
jgi:hypothetical protein